MKNKLLKTIRVVDDWDYPDADIVERGEALRDCLREIEAKAVNGYLSQHVSR